MTNLREVAEKIVKIIQKDTPIGDYCADWIEPILRESVEEAKAKSYVQGQFDGENRTKDKMYMRAVEKELSGGGSWVEIDQVERARSAARAEALEEAAKVAEEYHDVLQGDGIADKIRALGNKEAKR